MLRFLVKVVITLAPSLHGHYSLHRYYEPSDSSLNISISLLCRLGNRYFLRRSREVSHVHTFSLNTCHALGPRGCDVTCQISVFIMLPSTHRIVSATLTSSRITGLNHFSLRLRPAFSLSTLNSFCHLLSSRLDIEFD